VQGLQRYGDPKLIGTVWLTKRWAVHGDSHTPSQHQAAAHTPDPTPEDTPHPTPASGWLCQSLLWAATPHQCPPLWQWTRFQRPAAAPPCRAVCMLLAKCIIRGDALSYERKPGLSHKAGFEPQSSSRSIDMLKNIRTYLTKTFPGAPEQATALIQMSKNVGRAAIAVVAVAAPL